VIVVLASRSPRRRQLLEWAGITVDVQPSHIDETRRPSDDPVSHARRLAAEKAERVGPGRIVVAADTVVHVGDAIFEIPRDRDEARAHLVALSGRWHHVTTGVCVRGAAADVFAVTTRVRFRALPTPEIDAYLATGEADDKAGAYGIQGHGGALVAEVEGSWTNVMGLPLEQTLAALARA
jgi:septum formation protein